jgi:uncharacterized protein YdeI (BOF family)
MKNKIKITRCLFPSKNGNWTGVSQPAIKDMTCITTEVVNIGGRYYEQFEYIPDNLDLCCGGNAKRKGKFIKIKKNKNIENEENCSLRGKLVEEIVANFCEKNLYVFFDEIEKLLQIELDTHLKFETKISDLNQEGKFSSGNISFKDENEIIRVVNFTISICLK